MSEPLDFKKESELDEQIRQLLLTANTPEALGVDLAALEPVPAELEQRMVALLDDPFHAKPRARPQWRRALKHVACAVLAVAVALGGVLVISPKARAWTVNLIQMFIQWNDVNTNFIFTGEQTVETIDEKWRPTYVPEGFVESEEYDLSGAHQIEYLNGAGKRLYFEYMPVQEGYMVDMDNEHSDYSEFMMNNQTAYLFDSNTEGKPSYLVWFNEDGTISYNLLGWLSGEELVKIAESVEVQPYKAEE